MRKINSQSAIVNGQWSGNIPQVFNFLRFTFFTFCFLFFAISSFSQTVSASLDRNKILIGEQVTLQLKADIDEADYSLVSWYNFPDTINHIEVVNRSSIDTIETSGTISFVQTLTLTSFDSGLWQLPQLQIILQNKSGKQLTLKADSLSLQILPVDVSNLKDYHDIKSIIQVQAQDNWWMYAAIALAAIILIALIVWLWLKKRKKKIIPVKKSVIKGSALDWAMEQLDLLQKENYPAKDQTKIFYTRLDEIYRTYIDEQINAGVLQMTSDELMIRMKVYLSKENIRTKFFQLLRLADAVKFAKYLPDNLQNNESLETARDTIKYIDETLSTMKKNNAY